MIRATLTDGREVFVEFEHEQWVKFIMEDGKDKRYPNPTFIEGTDNAYAVGVTQCYIMSGPKDAAVMEGHGITYCSHHDQFNKETGRQIALWRAVTALSKADRGIVVNAYFNRQRGQKKTQQPALINN